MLSGPLPRLLIRSMLLFKPDSTSFKIDPQLLILGFVLLYLGLCGIDLSRYNVDIRLRVRPEGLSRIT